MASELAGRGTRLGAAIVDGLIVGIPVVVIFLGATALGGNDNSSTPTLAIALIALYCLGIFIVQIIKLHNQGQTLGKQFVGVKIVKVPTGENGGVTTNFLMRGVVPGLIGAIPILGALFSLVDILFIFREDRRCIHDLIAGTHVVVA